MVCLRFYDISRSGTFQRAGVILTFPHRLLFLPDGFLLHRYKGKKCHFRTDVCLYKGYLDPPRRLSEFRYHDVHPNLELESS
jgi:hypothetical protein